MDCFYLKINYGPYESHGIIRHKVQRLHGLVDLLTSENYNVDLIPSPHLNRVTIELFDREIFSCDIRYFLFNLPAANDFLCNKALKAIKSHQELYCQETNQPRYESIKSGMRCGAVCYSPSQEEKESMAFDYNLTTPQNSVRSGKSWTSCGELTDLFKNKRYTGYDLDSTDLLLGASDVSEPDFSSSTTTLSSTSEFLDEAVICEDSICFPTCPPASEAVISFLKREEQEQQEEQEEEQEEEEEQEQKPEQIEETDEFFMNQQGLYRCAQCGNCYCICDDESDKK